MADFSRSRGALPTSIICNFLASDAIRQSTSQKASPIYAADSTLRDHSTPLRQDHRPLDIGHSREPRSWHTITSTRQFWRRQISAFRGLAHNAITSFVPKENCGWGRPKTGPLPKMLRKTDSTIGRQRSRIRRRAIHQMVLAHSSYFPAAEL